MNNPQAEFDNTGPGLRPRSRPSGKTVLRGIIVPFSVGALGANVIGAVLVYFIAYLIPIENSTHVRDINRIALVAYLAVALPVGAVVTVRLLRPVIDWLRAERPPTPAERDQALRVPLIQMRVNAVLWLTAAPIFIGLNLNYSRELTIMVGIAVVLGAFSTCAFGYLVIERVTRDVVRLALESESPERPAAPGVAARMMLTWALSTGIPILGLGLISAAIAAGIVPSTGDQLASAAMLLCGIALVVGLLAMTLAARSVADPVESVRQALDRVRAGDLDASVPVYDGSEIGLLQVGFNNMAEGLRERERLRDIFGRHVGEDVARQALDRGSELGGELRDVAVLFIDLVGSTNITATQPPQEVVDLLNRFFAVVVHSVTARGGSINKFEGDAALCVFGAPDDLDDPAGAALASAREIVTSLGSELPELTVGVGVSAGPAVAGNVGANERFEYTVIGDPVNEAARLTEIAKQHPQHVLASSTAVAAARPDEAAHWELGGEIELRGRTSATRVAAPRL